MDAAPLRGGTHRVVDGVGREDVEERLLSANTPWWRTTVQWPEFLNSSHFSMEYNSLDVVAVHEHDVVPVGAIHVQVDLPDVGGESSGSGLQFLQKSRNPGNRWRKPQHLQKLSYQSLTLKPRKSPSSPPLFWECRAADTIPPLAAAEEFPYRSSEPAGRKHTSGEQLEVGETQLEFPSIHSSTWW